MVQQEDKNPATGTLPVSAKSAPVKSASVVKRKHKLVEAVTAIDEFFLEHDAMSVEKYRARKKLGMSVSKTVKPKKQSLYDELKVAFIKAGVTAEPVAMLKHLMVISGIIDIVISLLLLILGFAYAFSPLIVILVTIASLAVLFFVFYPLSYLLFRMVLRYKMFRRKLQIELVLPDFLRLVATNYRSGLPLDKALTKSNRPRFGVFGKEIELMAKTTKIKGDLSIALEIFGKKFESKILERAMNSISMSVKSGSNVSPLLEEIASNINKMRNMQASMAANVKNYIIFIVIAAVVIAPLMFGMSFAMNSTIDNIKSSMNAGGQDGYSQPSTLSAISFQGGIMPGDFDIFATLMLLTTSVISALVISMIRNGNFQQGVKNIPVFIIISNVLYYVGKVAIMSLLSVL